MVRRAQIVEVMLVALILLGFAPTQNRAMAGTTQALTTVPATSWQWSVRLTDRVNGILTGSAPEARRLRLFVRGASALMDWTRGECARLLLLRHQALVPVSRMPQVAAFLNKVREARASGVPEAQVRAMVRDGVARGDLRPNADAECRVEELNPHLAGTQRPATAESTGPMQISARQ